MDTYSYFTDGAATMINKNGKYLRKAGGWAFIQFKNGERQTQQYGGCNKTTNNEMELYAINASFLDFFEKSKPKRYNRDIYRFWLLHWNIHQMGEKLAKKRVEKEQQQTD